MASKKYEVLYPVRLDGKVKNSGVITLDPDGEDAATFLRTRAIRPVPGEDQKQEESGRQAVTPSSGGSLSMPEEAGREALLAAGFDADSRVRAATDDELLAVDGVGPKTLEKIREILPNESD